MTAAQASVALASGGEGLSAAEAAERFARHGPNRLPAPPERGVLMRFLAQFHNLLIYVLLASAAISVLIGHAIDAAVILGVVVVNAVIGAVQEGRAEHALHAIARLLDPRATVVRDGVRTTIAADQVVPGDIVLLEAGDRVPADMRLIRARNLRLDEAALTGESVASEKSEAPCEPSADLADRGCMAFSGTSVVTGQGRGLVVATGTTTELGRIGRLLGSVDTLRTPLLAQMDRFARQVTIVVLALSAVTFAAATLWRGFPVNEAFMAVVGLAVAAIPEGLPAVMTIALAVGVQRMARRNAIIRRLPAVETLGAVSVICTDKTGTLTCNVMAVTAAATMRGDHRVDGERSALPDPLLQALAEAGALCNDAALRADDGGARIDGDPMEGALLVFAAGLGVDPEGARAAAPRRDEIPFDAAHRFMATLHETADGPRLIVKGAPEAVLRRCAHARAADGTDVALDAAAWHARTEALADDGMRVLALATRAMPPGTTRIGMDDVVAGLTLLGLTGLIDPPRPEVPQAVADCRAAGIAVKMITGDHAVTARSIARTLALADDPVTVTGRDLDALDDEALQAVAREASVFARTTPEQKLRLVKALQANGATIAMTGDGVNDAPALKRADVGVAMGNKGTETAKAAAQVVLADDNFASIVAAVREGRTVRDNLTKVIAYTLPTNGGEALVVIGAIALGMTLPVTALQILWINLVTEIALGLTLAFEPSDPMSMTRKPRPPSAPLLDGPLVWQVVWVSLLMAAATFGVFMWAQAAGASLDVARTMAVNTVVVTEIFYLFSIRRLTGTGGSLLDMLGTRVTLAGVGTLIVLQLAFTYAAPLNSLFQTAPLSLADWGVVLAAGFGFLALVELEMAVRRSVLRRAPV